jgi:hypothetical protein
MAIKVPDKLVYYSDRDHEVEMLLCWIPPSKFDNVAENREAADRLRQNYPKGVEVRVEPKELKAEGIKLEVAPDDLAKIYRAFRERNALHESGMVSGQTLQRNAKALQKGASIDDLVGPAGEPYHAMPPPGPGAAPWLVHPISELPEMVGDEEPVEAFQRLSVRQHRLAE